MRFQWKCVNAATKGKMYFLWQIWQLETSCPGRKVAQLWQSSLCVFCSTTKLLIEVVTNMVIEDWKWSLWDTSSSSIKMMANKWCELLLSFKSVTAFSLFWTSESKRFPWSAPRPGRHGSKWGEAKPQSETSFQRTWRIVKGFAYQLRCSWHCQMKPF